MAEFTQRLPHERVFVKKTGDQEQRFRFFADNLGIVEVTEEALTLLLNLAGWEAEVAQPEEHDAADLISTDAS